MSIKKKTNNGWKIIASSQSSEIAVSNSQLVTSGNGVTSVESVLVGHDKKIRTLERNVAWLAAHGGGGGSAGSGGSGGGTSTGEATCTIMVGGMENAVATGNDVTVDDNGITINLINLSSSQKKSWNVTVRIGANQIYTGNASYLSPKIYIPLSSFKARLNNHTGRLYVDATYSDDASLVYGSASWEGNVIESTVELSMQSNSYGLDFADTATVDLTYSIGVRGDYKLLFKVTKPDNSSIEKTVDITIDSTQQQTASYSYYDIIGVTTSTADYSQLVGIHKITVRLYNAKSTNIYNEVTGTITFTSDKIAISSLSLSTDASNPTSFSISGNMAIRFSAYVNDIQTFKYKYQIGKVDITSWVNGRFGQEIVSYIPISGKSWAVKNEIAELTIIVMVSETNIEEKSFYVTFSESGSEYLTDTEDATSHKLFSFLSREYDESITTGYTVTNNDYTRSGKKFPITSTMEFINGNSLTHVTMNTSNGTPSLRFSNGAFAKIEKFNYGTYSQYLKDLISSSSNYQFTISICFKADYHPDDDRTIFYMGKTDSNNGDLLKGISVDVHDVLIDNTSVAKLTDSSVNMVDITCTRVETKESGGNDKIEYVIKVYVDGVASSVSMKSTIMSTTNTVIPFEFDGTLYIAGKEYNSVKEGYTQTHLCDCNIYNFEIFDTPLSDYDIMQKYINNKVSANWVDNAPDYNMISEELKKNFCERQTDGSVVSNLYDVKSNQYTVNFLLGYDNNNRVILDSKALQANANAIGIPVMLIDVSNIESWTFNVFVQQQSQNSDSLSMPTAENVPIYYWDPNGTNSSVVTIESANVEIQGTSTLSDAVKNLNITLPSNSVFIPKAHWMPEETYTLKADVVDSSHSNNAAIGKFINDAFGYDEETGASKWASFPMDSTAVSNFYDSEYHKQQQPQATLKHTVEGFPVLLIMNFHTTESSTVSTTPLGIYSFNLGRNAYRNLGFKKLVSITKDASNIEISTFPFSMAGVTYNEIDVAANWIEIKDTNSISGFTDSTSDTSNQHFTDNFVSPFGDFWQSDNTILNYNFEVRYPKDTSLPSDYSTFVSFVKNIMSFPVEGVSTTDNKGTVSRPDITGTYNLYGLDAENKAYLTGDKQQIITDTNTIDYNKLPYNDDSFFGYFVIANLFGLVDNFGKNSTYRQWGADGKYHIDFYDMDTALGGDNQGELSISTDVWLKYLYNRDSHDEGFGYIAETYDKSLADGNNTTISANTNKLWMSLDTQFYRTLKGASNSLYATYWHELRLYLQTICEKAGYSNFADYFIETYFKAQTGSCGPLVFNYDYKLKYLLQFTNDSYDNSSKAISKLHGRKIEYCRWWLKQHILFLDSLFFWRDQSGAMTYKNNVASASDSKVYNTPQTMPMKTNASIVMRNNVGDAIKTFYYMKANKATLIDMGANQSNSIKTWNFTNSPNVIEIGDSEQLLSEMNVSLLSASVNDTNSDGSYNDDNNMYSSGFPAITDLNLANNKTFSKEFNLKDFERGTISEIRTLNFSNTQCQDGSSMFSLDLVHYGTSGAWSKFTKVTEIDISNSKCISSLSIPDIPLKNLNVNNSYIQTFSITDQQYISDINLNNCTKLRRIEIQNCDSYTTIDLDGISNLDTVSLLNNQNLETVKIINCPSLKQINIEGNPKLKSITINDSKVLTGSGDDNHIVIAGCTSLTSIDLSMNEKLKTVHIDNSNEANITTLNLRNTDVSYIQGYTDVTTGIDLRNMVNLEHFCCENDASVEYIYYPNIKDNPILVGPYSNNQGTFKGCSKLKRIYGNVLFKNGYSYNGSVWGLFYGCSNFSLFGDDTTWNGTSIKKSYDTDNTGLYDCDGDLVKTNEGTYTATYCPNEDLDEYVWIEGDNVLNFKFYNDSNVLYQIFYGTNCNQFDVYYTFYALRFSNITVSISVTRPFYNLKNDVFDWSENEQPALATFKGCSNITSFNEAFTSSKTKLRERLFEPLPKLSGIGRFTSGNLVISKNIFNRKDGSTFSNFWSLSYQGMMLIYDKDSSATYSICNSATELYFNLDNFDDISTFFDGIPNIQSIDNAFNLSYINYDKLKLPASITKINSAFCANTVATGKIDLNEIFPANSKCTTLTNCFRVNLSIVNNAAASYLGSEYKSIDFPIGVDTFSHLPNLVTVGYGDANAGSIDSTAFNGSQLNKYTEAGEFPYSIVSKCTKLERFAGFFKNCKLRTNVTPELPGNMFQNTPKLKNISTLFEEMTFDTGYNDVGVKLTSNSFANCTSLENVYHLFKHTINSSKKGLLTGSVPFRFFYHGYNDIIEEVQGIDENYVDTITGYTYEEQTEQESGKTYNVVTEMPTDITASSQQYIAIETDGVWKYYHKVAHTELIDTVPDSTYSGDVKSQYITRRYYNKTITNMTQCFAGNIGLEHYEMETGMTEMQMLNNGFVEPNEDYSPFKYVYNKSTGTWSESTSSDEYDASWSYDGASEELESFNSKSIRYIDKGSDIKGAMTYDVIVNGVTKNHTKYYCCAPDLFRYCVNNGDLAVTGIFENCGYNYSQTGGGWMPSDGSANYFSKGIDGRLPSYLLNPISSVTSISQMFKNCRRLCCFETNDGIVYFFPENFFAKANKITSLVEAFQGMSFNYQTNFGAISQLTRQLDVRKMFAMCIFNVPSGSSWDISGMFRANNVAGGISGVFSLNDLNIDNSDTLKVTYGGEYSNIGASDRVTFSSNFPTSSAKRPDERNTGYVYFLWPKSSVTDSSIPDKNSNYTKTS